MVGLSTRPELLMGDITQERATVHLLLVLVLAYQDSNLDKQNQNLLCCHYTISQTYRFEVLILKSEAKIMGFYCFAKF